MAKKAENNPEKKVIVREIVPKFKVTEIKKEEESPEEIEEESPLEDIAVNAPSAREFPGVVQNAQPVPEQQRTEEATTTPAATTEAEGRNAARYQVQGNVTESEIRKNYDAPPRFERREDSRDVILQGSRGGGISRSALVNPEIEAFRAESSDDSQRYEINIESKPKTKHKYPWEA